MGLMAGHLGYPYQYLLGKVSTNKGYKIFGVELRINIY